MKASLRCELKNRFSDEELHPALEKLLIHTRSADVFPIFQSYFFEDYKSNDRLKAAFDGTVLVQLVSQDERELFTLSTLPKETQARVKELFEVFRLQIADQNQELAGRLKAYFDEHIGPVLTAVSDVKRTVQDEHEVTRRHVTDEVNRVFEQGFEQLRETRSEQETQRRRTRQRIAGALLFLPVF